MAKCFSIFNRYPLVFSVYAPYFV